MAAGAPAPIVAAVTTAEFAVLIAGLIILDALSDGIPDIRDEARFGACQERKAKVKVAADKYNKWLMSNSGGNTQFSRSGVIAADINAKTIIFTPREKTAFPAF